MSGTCKVVLWLWKGLGAKGVLSSKGAGVTYGGLARVWLGVGVG